MKSKTPVLYLSLIIALFLFPCFLFPLQAKASSAVIADGFCGSSLQWTLDADGLLFIRGSGEMYDSDPVGNDYAPWDSYKSQITKVKIGIGATNIGNYAFWNCVNLTDITIPYSVTSIDYAAFMNCTGLTEITFPKYLDSISVDAFCNCSNLTGIEIPDTVTFIGGGAFGNCSNLADIKIPNTDAVISGAAFIGCDKINDIPGNHSGLKWSLSKKEGTLVISGNSYYFNFSPSNNEYAPWNDYKDMITTVIIKNGTTFIGSYAFWNLKNLKSISIPDSVTRIGEGAFCICGLQTITLPASVTTIEKGAFLNSSLTSIEMPGVAVIGERAFSGCNLTSAVLPFGLKKIPDKLFFDCQSLSSVTIPDSVTFIGEGAFQGCIGLNAIHIPESVTTILPNAFRSCSQLSSVTIPDGITKLERNTFSNCPQLAELTILNPLCSIDASAVSNSDITICSYDHSTAYDFASSHEYAFRSLGKPSVSYWKPQLSPRENYYTGEAVCPAVTLNGLKQNIDFTVSYRNNINAGEAMILISGTGDYTGNQEIPFTIYPTPVHKLDPILEYTNAAYTGSPIEPAVTIDGLRQGTDYTVSYKKNINVGTASVIITGIGNYSSGIMQIFSINARDISDMNGILEYETTEYTGFAKEPDVSLKGLIAGKDFSCSYSNNINAGTASVTITGINNCKGSLTLSFQITPKSLSGNEVSLPPYFNYVYNGRPKEPVPVLKDLAYGIDYTVTYENNTNTGTAAMLINGKGNYAGQLRLPFTITPAPVHNTDFNISISSCTYNGTEQTPAITARNLKPDTDYTVTYADNINSGTASAVITGIGNYTGTATKYFRIEPLSLKNRSFSLSQDSYVYDGAPKYPTVLAEGLKENTDFLVSYYQNTNDGTAVIYIDGIHNYKERVMLTFQILPQPGAAPKANHIPAPANETTVPIGQILVFQNGLYKITSAQTMEYCKSTVQNITRLSIPDTVIYNHHTYQVTSVAANAMKNHKSLRQISLGKNIESIGNHAFRGCTALTRVTCTSKKLSSIGKKAFYGDKKLKTLRFKTRKLKKSGIGANAFGQTSPNCTFKFPKEKARQKPF